jgi:hypothetical protein
MATIDPSIAMGYKPVQIENPLNQLAAMTQIQSGQQGQQLNALQMQKAQLELEDRNMLRGLDPNAPDYISNITRINPQLGLELLTKEQTRKTQQIDRETKINALTQQTLRNLSSDPTDININKNFDRFVSSGLFDANHIAAAKDQRDQLLALPLTDRVPFLSRIGATAGDLKPVNQVINAGGQVLSRNIDPYSSRVLNQETIEKTPTIADKIAESNLGINQQELVLKLKRFDQDTKSLTPQETALLSQAILEGRLDPNAVNSRNSKILATTLTAKPDANLVDLNLDVVGKKAGERTLATTGANIQVAANEAKEMIDVVSKYSNKIDRTQYPTINSLQNAVDRGTGGVEIVQLNAALNALVNIYARAINPRGVATVSDKTHAREMINSAYSKGQIDGITDVMKQEMNAAIKSTGRARTQIRGKEDTQFTTSDSGASPTTVTTSDGKTYSFPTPEDAAKFKQAAGIK